MRLKASCQLTIQAPTPAPIVAMLRPRSGEAQWIGSESYEFDPFTTAVEDVDGFGNLCQRLVSHTGGFQIRTQTVIEVADKIAVNPGGPVTAPESLPDSALQFLLPSRYCPADTLEKFALQTVGNATPGYDQVEAIRSWVRANIEYKYGVSTGSTTAADTIRDGAGVCRDFSHIGISLCRALRIPARMVVGYLYRLDPMDLHAWFEAYVDGRWYTFDATQSEPLGGRIAIAYGRDAADVALITEFGALTIENMHVSVQKIG